MSSKNRFGPVKRLFITTKWPVGIWAPSLWSIWKSCKLDAGSSNSYSFTGPNVQSTSIYLGKYCSILLSNINNCSIQLHKFYNKIGLNRLSNQRRQATQFLGIKNKYTSRYCLNYPIELSVLGYNWSRGSMVFNATFNNIFQFYRGGAYDWTVKDEWKVTWHDTKRDIIRS